MFAGKIEGTNRDKLLQHLHTLYFEGYWCLLRCDCLADDMSFIMNRHYSELVTMEPRNSTIAIHVITECQFQVLLPFKNEHECATGLIACILMYHNTYSTNNHQNFILKTWLHQKLTALSMTDSSCRFAEGRCNRSKYRNLKKKMNVLRRCRTDSVCHLLYQAMLCHNNGKYNQALKLAQHSKEKILAPCSMYTDELPGKECKELYERAGGDRLPVETMKRKYGVDYIRTLTVEYIPELFIECNSNISSQCIMKVIIPPLICAFFLQFLCNIKIGHLREADEALYELSLLVRYDEGHHVAEFYREISWQILGICQQMRGDDWAACQSYLMALQQEDALIKTAACIRLGTILVKYF